jgi:3-oxoacyl-[acyl-carrier protein] reductase
LSIPLLANTAKIAKENGGTSDQLINSARIGSAWFTKYQGSDAEQHVVDTVIKSTPLQVASQPEDIAEAILFFAGPESRHVTGEFMIIDAGMHLGAAPLRAR